MLTVWLSSIGDASVRPLDRHKVHNALIRSRRVRSLIDDFTKASAGRDDKAHGDNVSMGAGCCHQSVT
jgi:hypothetical protein